MVSAGEIHIGTKNDARAPEAKKIRKDEGRGANPGPRSPDYCTCIANLPGGWWWRQVVVVVVVGGGGGEET